MKLVGGIKPFVSPPGSCYIRKLYNQLQPELTRGAEGQRFLGSVFLSSAAAHQEERGRCSNKPFLMTVPSVQAGLERKSFHGFMSTSVMNLAHDLPGSKTSGGQLLPEDAVTSSTLSPESGSFPAP